ncbi:MAG: heterodisulfide reductase-related iron-sulfur binding cluster, partial [Candidatus Bathyarchaeia archaeon]
LLMVNTILKNNRKIRNKVNEVLAEVDKEFKGKVDVKHLIDVLYENGGIEKVKNAVTQPFKELMVATQPGCHLTKPKRLHFGLFRGFTALDELVAATGAESVDYERKEMCCGGPLRDINDDLARQVAKQKLINIRNAKVDCIVTVCPFCYIELDLGQLEIKRHFNEEFNLPVLHFIELLRLAMGMKLTNAEVKTHKIPITGIIKEHM